MSTTMELVLLDEGGQFVASLRPTVTSAPEFVKFENRHYRRTGKLRDSPEEWQYVRAHTVSGRKDCVVFIGDGCPVWRTGDPPMITTTHGDAPSVVTGNGLRYVYAPGFDSGATATDDRDTTIAEQAAEIERLKETRDELRERLARREKQLDYASIDRPLLRAELELAERQRDEAVSHCEIMAAEVRRLTEERDEAELLAWKSGMRAVPPADDMCPDCNGHGTIFSPTEPLPDLCYLCSGTGKVAPSTLKAAGGSERDALKKRISDLEGKHGWQWYEQKLGEANARAEKCLAVIAAQSDMIEEQERHNEIALRLSQAYSVAGFATDVLQVGDVPRVKEADRG